MVRIPHRGGNLSFRPRRSRFRRRIAFLSTGWLSEGAAAGGDPLRRRSRMLSGHDEIRRNWEHGVFGIATPVRTRPSFAWAAYAGSVPSA